MKQCYSNRIQIFIKKFNKLETAHIGAPLKVQKKITKYAKGHFCKNSQWRKISKGRLISLEIALSRSHCDKKKTNWPSMLKKRFASGFC